MLTGRWNNERLFNKHHHEDNKTSQHKKRQNRLGIVMADRRARPPADHFLFAAGLYMTAFFRLGRGDPRAHEKTANQTVASC